MLSAFQSEGTWYKANLHTHTTLSDGVLTPQERRDAYRAQGYQVLALTDHNKQESHEHLNTDDMILIPGVELHPDNEVGRPGYHVVALGMEDRLDPSASSCQQLIDRISHAKGMAVLAHPYWCGLNIQDLAHLNGYLGIEVFNTTCFRGIGKGLSSTHWDDLLDLGHTPYGLAVDDAHHRERDVFQGWTMMKATELTLPSLLHSLKTGAFYSSNGPLIHEISFDDQTLHVTCSPVAHINFICSRSQGNHVETLVRNNHCEASCVLESELGYVRVECTDERGKTAWTQPMRLFQ